MDYSNYITYLLTCCGALPGSAIDVCTRSRRIFFNILNTFCLLIVTARLVVALSTGWTNTQDEPLETTIYKSNYTLWQIMVTSQAFILAFTSYKYSRAYHDSYSRAAEYLRLLQVDINRRRERNIQIFLFCSAVVCAVGMISTNMLNYKTIDPFFGDSLRNRTTPEVFSVLHGFGGPTFVLCIAYRIFSLTYFISTAVHVISLIDSFNKTLLSKVKTSKFSISADMRQYRHAHSLLSDLVNEANTKLSLSTGVSLLISTILQFLVIYIIVKRRESVSESLSFIFWILSEVVNSSTTIWIGDIVKKKVIIVVAICAEVD